MEGVSGEQGDEWLEFSYESSVMRLCTWSDNDRAACSRTGWGTWDNGDGRAWWTRESRCKFQCNP